MRIPFIALFFFLTLTAFSQIHSEIDLQDSTGFPGDHFSLEGALELFKNAHSPEDFEKQLNAETSSVNNLDLNLDGQTDYIRVVDKSMEDGHALVLQVDLSDNERQDLAVIEIQKNGEESAIAQIVGDKDIYGNEKIVEAIDHSDVESISPTGRGPSIEVDQVHGIWVNVWFWPCVRYMYRPGYVLWVSPWYWRHHPYWWKPWKIKPWYGFYGYGAHYRRMHRVVYVHRTIVIHRNYFPGRHNAYAVRTKKMERNHPITRNANPTVRRTNSGKLKNEQIKGRNTRSKSAKSNSLKGRRYR